MRPVGWRICKSGRKKASAYITDVFGGAVIGTFLGLYLAVARLKVARGVFNLVLSVLAPAMAYSGLTAHRPMRPKGGCGQEAALRDAFVLPGTVMPLVSP
jgi:hypothetical protein